VRGYTDPPAPVAQGIERCPAEAEVACSNHAGRMARPNHSGDGDAAERVDPCASFLAPIERLAIRHRSTGDLGSLPIKGEYAPRSVPAQTANLMIKPGHVTS
jgi:hypothetical protein